jgi:CRP-like cAMP-binding protein
MGLSPTHLTLARVAVHKRLPRRALLWSVNERADAVFLIRSGVVEIVRPSAAGEESILGIFGVGDVVGASAFLHKTSYPASARAVTDLELGAFDRAAEEALGLAERRELHRELSRVLKHHEDILRAKIDILSTRLVETRIAKLFQHLAPRFPTAEGCPPGWVGIAVPLTKSQIARCIDARIETTIRLLNQWEKLGALEVWGGGLRVHPTKLAALSVGTAG